MNDIPRSADLERKTHMQQTRMATRRILMIPFTTVAIVVVLASVAWACTTFTGQFHVTGDRGGTVTATGSGAQMTNVITGSTEATAGGTGWIRVSTNATVTSTAVTKLPAGTYYVNVWDGHAYNLTSHVTLDPALPNNPGDCMTPRDTDGDGEPNFGTTLENLGQVTVDSDGEVSGKVGSTGTYLSATKQVEYGLSGVSASSGLYFVEPLGGGESAVCIADKSATYGNQVPVTFI